MSGDVARRVDVLGVGIDPVTVGQALDRIAGFLERGGTHHVVTVNPEYVMAGRSRPEFRRVLLGADLALADGIGIVLAARALGRPLPGRVTGVGLVPRLAVRAGRAGHAVYLAGAGPGVAEAAAARLRELDPAVRIAGTLGGSPHAAEADEIVARVRDAAPGVLFVAYGAPDQDLWIDRYRDRLGVPVLIGVGGAFDFLAGVQRRAPRAVRAIGLEWLWRLTLEPWRWRRQMALPRFAAAVAMARLGRGRWSAR
jgi:N-acetylglucosaminyldiphosphoundecaprenol N-acetyl-beta-D-mannosaminyltransferase